jgi:hypothetical protein
MYKKQRMTFKNPSHQSLEQSSFNEPNKEEDLQKKQTTSELVKEPKEGLAPIVDTTEKDKARVGEIKSQIEESYNKHDHDDGIDHMLEATKRNRENIKRINALKRAEGEPVTQQKTDNWLDKVKSFFGGKSE